MAKLFSEKSAGHALAFRVEDSPRATAASINSLLARASSRWSGIVNGEARSFLTDQHLEICVEAIMNHSICDTNIEILDGFFEFLVSHVAKGSKGQYFTPRQIIDCCVKIMDPAPTESVLDPACGSGGFLVHVLNHNSHRIKMPLREYCAKYLWGCDFDRRAIQIAKALMLVSGDGSTNLHQLNSLFTETPTDLLEVAADGVPKLTIEDLLRSKTRKFPGFDVVLTNPPFAGEIKERSLVHRYQLSKKNRRMERDVLFLERCVQLLRPGGRLGIVLPHNKFAGASWAYLREWLVRNMRIVSVLGLDRHTFLPHTHQKTSVLFGVKRPKPILRPEGEPVLFTVSESSGKDSTGRIRERPGVSFIQTAWERADHDLDSVVAHFRDFTREHDVGWGS